VSYRLQASQRVSPSSDRVPHWHEEAVCNDGNAHLFFADHDERWQARERREQEAKALCRTCPVRLECLEHALTYPEYHGVWGATSREDRQRLRREKRWPR
jgi:WhiB family redox-sensing transcriptional regulator